MDYKEIDNINDRTNLVLLNHIKNKGRRFKKLEKKLSDKYPDNILYERVIVDRMKSIDLMKVANTEMGVDKLGQPYSLHSAELRYDCVTEKGIEALKIDYSLRSLERRRSINGLGVSKQSGSGFPLLVDWLQFCLSFISSSRAALSNFFISI